jgi:hypothetical protein
MEESKPKILNQHISSRIAVLGWLLATLIFQSYASAQVDDQPLSSFLYGRTGFHLKSLTVSGAYYSNGGLSPLASAGGGSVVGADVLISGGASMGWQRSSERSAVAFNYSPTYMTYTRHSELNASTHALYFSAHRQLSPKWNFSTGLTGMYSTMEQLLFTPTAFRTAAALPASFEQFANTLLKNPFTNEQLAAMLTGSPVVEAPSRQLLFGDTVFTSSANLSLSYAASSRTAVSISAAGSRMQPIVTERNNLSRVSLLSQSTTANVGLTLSHSITPRTQMGVNVNESRTVSTIQDGYNTSGSVFIGRKMGMHWFAQVYGGTGFMRFNRQLYKLPTGLQWQAGGSIGYKLQAHTFLFSSGRTFGDSYGIGAGSTTTVSAAWNWSPPRSAWSLFSTVSEQWFQERAPGNLQSLQVATGLTRTLSPHLSIATDYVFINSTGRSLLMPQLSQHAVRASLIWTPQPVHAAPR